MVISSDCFTPVTMMQWKCQSIYDVHYNDHVSRFGR
jgi:hypothetical protein